jgi:hypothetical protein
LHREFTPHGVIGPDVPYEHDPELAYRVWKRIAERIATEGVAMAVFG